MLWKGFAKLDHDPDQAALDAGVIAVRDAALAEQAQYYETCLSEKSLECRGCFSGVSHWDAVVIAARGRKGLKSGTKIFLDTDSDGLD